MAGVITVSAVTVTRQVLVIRIIHKDTEYINRIHGGEGGILVSGASDRVPDQEHHT